MAGGPQARDRRGFVRARCVGFRRRAAIRRQTAISVFAWRKRFGDGSTASPAAQLVPVILTSDLTGKAPPAPPADTIEIELASGHRVRVGGGVKAASLRLVLDALGRR